MSLDTVEEANGDTQRKDIAQTEDTAHPDDATQPGDSRKSIKTEYSDPTELRCGISVSDDTDE